MQDLSELIESARQDFAQAEQPAALEDAKAKYIGKSGAVTALMKSLGQLAPEERRARGQEINKAKAAIEAALNARREQLAQAAMQAKLASEAIDVTLPGRVRTEGGIHPVMRTWMRIEEIFRSIGFDVADGPEIESDWFSFTALNNPPNHPARSMQDTFYVDRCDEEGRQLPLRPHTSPMQVRYFETDDLVVRFRPSYFPFTEPSVEVDMMFTSGPRKGKWLEISGAGEVHPNVVRNFGLDPEKHIGFAFGSGLERLTMLRYGIDDLRLFFEGDLRFLRQFN